MQNKNIVLRKQMNNKVIDVEGIIINVKNYGDTSKIIDILTKEYGVIGVIAKGCKSLKSNLRSVTDKLTYATFTIYFKKDKLSILSEASVKNNFCSVKTGSDKTVIKTKLSGICLRQAAFNILLSL